MTPPPESPPAIARAGAPALSSVPAEVSVFSVRRSGRRHLNWALADQALVSSVNFVTGVLLARYLGLEEFGRFTLVWTVVLLVGGVRHAAIHAPMMSIGPKAAEDEAPGYYGAILLHEFIFSGLAFLLVYAGTLLAAWRFPGWGAEGLALPLAAATFAVGLQELMRRYFFTRERGRVAFGGDAVRYGGQIGLVGVLVFSLREFDTAMVLWVIAATSVAALVSGGFFVERIRLSAVGLRRVAARHWSFSSWMTASAAAQWAADGVFLVTAGALLGSAAVGALKATQTLMGVTHIFFMGLENVAPVRAAAHYHSGGRRALASYLKRIVWLGGALTLPAAIAVSIAPEFWLALAFGSQYAGYGHLLRGYALIYLVVFMFSPLQAGLRAIERTPWIFRAVLVGSLFSLVVAYPLIHWFGLAGVLVGILITRTIQVTLLSISLGGQLRASEGHAG